LWIRQFGVAKDEAMLSKWPLARPQKWVNFVNEPASEKEPDALRRSCIRGTPYGDDDWMKETAKKIDLESTLRRPRRPKKR
jgi:putative transposase